MSAAPIGSTTTRSARSYVPVIVALGIGTNFAALGLGRFAYTLILPGMRASLGLNNAEAGLIATAQFVAYLLAALGGGALAERLGYRCVVGSALCLAGAGMLATSFATDLAGASSGQFLVGLGSGAAFVPGTGLVVTWVGAARRGRALGLMAIGTSGAMILTGLGLPLVIEGGPGWPLAWQLMGLGALLIGLVALALVREPPRTTPAPISPAAGVGWGNILRSGQVWLLSGVYAAFGFSYSIFITFFGSYLRDQRYSLAIVGLYWALVGLGSMVGGVLWGTLSDRFGRRPMLLLAYGLLAVSYAALARAGEPLGVLAAVVLFSVSVWAAPVLMSALSADYFGARATSAVLGFLTLHFGLGQALSPYLGGAIADRTGSFTLALVVAAGVSLVGAAGAWLSRPPPADAG